MILGAARACLERDGALNLREVADRLHVRTPSLYEYFPSLDALREELVRAGFIMLGEELRAAAKRERSLLFIGRAYRMFVKHHPRLYHLMREPGTGRIRGHAIGQFVIQPIADILNIRVDDPGFLPVSRILWSFVHGFVTLEQAGQFFAGGDLDRTFETGIRALAASREIRKPPRS